MSIDIVYFSNYSGNTKKFVEKLGIPATRIEIQSKTIEMDRPFVLFVPTYGGGSDRSAIPKQVRAFLNVTKNRDLLQGVVGFGNTNFGEHFCKAADMISQKTGVPIVARVEIFGTEHDVQKVKERLEILYG
ncbi:MAG: class Ib ribonucleoside-diphosphate reductase assembly flavoprotein NrdI [Burkholderiaceae bacterium]|nr:class Ib ribonucleoside-diphosphate reductase assembly flavoprotein NrdI [Burkholderiaceae bacterium]